MNKDFREKILTSFCVSLFFALTLFAFGPVNLYLINIVEFSSSFAELWPIFFSLTLACTLIMTIFLIFLKLTIYRKAVSVLLAASFLLWVQGNILVWDYGTLDGTDIEMHTRFFYGLIDSGIWISTIVGAFMASTYLSKNARGISVIFILVQLIPVIVNARQAPDVSETRKNLGADIEAVYEFSPESNVLIIVLDAFQGDIFNDIIAEDSYYYRNIFDGFTYFRNALSAYPVTYASVPQILTGRYYDNSVPFPDFLKSAFSTDSAPAILSREGYQVDMIGHSRFTYSDETIPANRAEVKQFLERSVKMEEATWILDITLFRYLPHFAKKYVYNNQAWLFSNFDSKSSLAGFPAGYHRDSIEFMMKFADRTNANCDSPTFKYIHLDLTHGPVRINEDIEYVEVPVTRSNFTGQAKAALKLVDDIFEKMENIGVYDNTMIFVVADHGGPAYVNVAMKIAGAHEEETKSPIFDRRDDQTFQYIKARALPLILFKPVMARGDLDTSDAPVCLSDIPKTIVSELGLRNKTPGLSIPSIGETDHRDRKFFSHNWGRRFLSHYKNHMPPLEEYIVSGQSWLDESWYLTNRVYAYGKVTQELSTTYNYGAKIDFGIDGNYTSYQTKGWSYPENGVTWNNHKNAKIFIPIQKTDSNLVLTASFTPYIVPGEVDRQRVNVSFNGHFITAWLITDGAVQEQTALIPNRFLEDGVATISFGLPDTTLKPASKGEPRVLGIGMHSLMISISESEMQVYRWGSFIRFDRKRTYGGYQENGWSSPEEYSMWTDGKSASLIIPISKTESDIQLKATLRPYVVPGKIEKQRVIISVNGKHAGDWVITREGGIWKRIRNRGLFQEQTIHIPNSLINDEKITLTFELPDAISPAELGMSEDTRELALAVASIVLTELVPESVN